MNFNFGFDENVSENGSSKYLEPGIHEVELKKIAYEPASDRSREMVLAFYFEDARGSSFVHKEFTPSIEMWKKKAAEKRRTLEEHAKIQIRLLGERLKHIMASFRDVSTLKIQGGSFVEMAKSYIQEAGTSFQGKQLRIKLIKDGKYASFPFIVQNGGFIEAAVEGMPSRLVLTPEDLGHDKPKTESLPKPQGFASFASAPQADAAPQSAFGQGFGNPNQLQPNQGFDAPQSDGLKF